MNPSNLCLRPEASWLFASLGFGRHLVFHATVGLASCRTTRTGETLETQGEAHVDVSRFWSVSWAVLAEKKDAEKKSRKMEIDGPKKNREDALLFKGYMSFCSWNYWVVFRFGFQVLYIVFSLKGRVPKYGKHPGDINGVVKRRRCLCHFCPELFAKNQCDLQMFSVYGIKTSN